MILRTLTLLTIFSILIVLESYATIIYVGKPTDHQIQDGKSWQTAFHSLQEALSVSNEGDSLWIIEDSYFPSETGDREKYFLLRKGVSLFGGFQGNETKLEDRSKDKQSILSGDIGISRDSLDNSYTVLRILEADSTSLIDGIIIEHGTANELSNMYFKNGGGVYIEKRNSSTLPKFRNCIFRYNSALEKGGGLYITPGTSESLLNITNCAFENNDASMGGGIYLERSSALLNIYRSKFTRNIATILGAGICRQESTGKNQLEKIVDCDFIENNAHLGGGIYLISFETNNALDISNSNFLGNTAFQGSGIHFTQPSSAIHIDSCYFKNNLAFVGIFSSEEEITLSNSIFEENRSTKTVAEDSLGNISIVLFDIIRSNDFSKNKVENCQFINNRGSFHFRSTSIDKIQFKDNIGKLRLSGRITNSIFLNNVGRFGPLVLEPAFRPTFTHQILNCIFANNEAMTVGGAIHNNPGNIYTKIANSVFYNNKARLGGNVLNNSGGTNHFVNCILWDNGEADNLFFNILADEELDFSFDNCLFDIPSIDSLRIKSAFIADLTETRYLDNIPITSNEILYNISPQFKNPELNDFSLLGCSPLINQGNSKLIDSLLQFDFIGQPRIQDGQVDIGAYEQTPSPLNIEYEIKPTSTESAIDGQITIENISGGIPPYNLLWNTGGNSYTINQLARGDYSVIITDNEGCKKEFDLSVSFLTTTTMEQGASTEVTIFPNPTGTNNIQLKVGVDKPSEFKLSWYNTWGQLLKTEAINITSNHAVLLSLPSLTSGLYWLEIKHETQRIAYKKIWKQ